MAEFIGIPYSQIAKAAVIPALLYFIAKSNPLKTGIQASKLGVSTAMEGYMFTHANKFERAAFLIGRLLLIYPEAFTDIIGLVILVIMFFYQKRKSLKAKV